MKRQTALTVVKTAPVTRSLRIALAATLIALFPSYIVPTRPQAGASELDSKFDNSTKFTSDDATQSRASEAYAKLPLSFEANQGQIDRQVSFLSRGKGYTLFLTPREAVVVLNSGVKQKDAGLAQNTAVAAQAKRIRHSQTNLGVVSMTLPGANPRARLSGMDELPCKINYFIGNDPKKWRTGIPSYAGVKYQSVYRGIDLIYNRNQQQLEYDFAVAPGADPRAISLRFQGADRIEIDTEGDLVLHTGADEIRHHKPFVYQEVDGIRQTVAGRYVLKGKRQVGFQIAEYDASKPLVIDPTVSYSTYLGGDAGDVGNGIAVDSAGNAYVTGVTASTKFPLPAMTSVPRALSVPPDAFVAKVKPDDSGLSYFTYIGGSDYDEAKAIAVDSAGNAYITGVTNSRVIKDDPAKSFPILNAYQPQKADISESTDAFVTRLNASGGIVYSTYLGGAADAHFVGGNDQGNAIAVDNIGNAYVTGQTSSVDIPGTPQNEGFPLAKPLQGVFGGANDAFVAKVNTNSGGLGSLVYSTYLGGSLSDTGNGIAIDSVGNAYVTGYTDSTNFPFTSSTSASAFNNGGRDAFVAKLNATGSGVMYCTYLGGSGTDVSNCIAVDLGGNAYVAGQTFSPNLTTSGVLGGSNDAFVTKFSPGGARLYSTYLGGASDDVAFGIAVDSGGNAYVTGATNSGNFPTSANAFQTTCEGCLGDGLSDAFVTKLNPAGNMRVYSSYLGGRFEDAGRAIAVDISGNAYVTGFTSSFYNPDTPQFKGFPVVNSLQANCQSCPDIARRMSDAFVTKFDLQDISSIPTITSFSPASGAAGTTVSITGTKFSSPTIVSFNGVSATTVTFNSSTSITATVPDCATSGPISVTTTGGTSTTASTFSVPLSTSAPTIASFAPTSAQVGMSVTLMGTNFTCFATVSFNGVSSTAITYNSSTSLTATVPACATSGPISVTTTGGTARTASSFNVMIPAGAPAITSFTPTSGPALRTTVTIFGRNFTSPATVSFNGVNSTIVTVASANSIRAVVPQHATTGRICVTTPSGTGTSSGRFIVTTNVPTITSFSPTSGPLGTEVTIIGTNFVGATAVKLNGVSVPFKLASSTVITLTVLAKGVTTGPISVTTPLGTATSRINFTVTF